MAWRLDTSIISETRRIRPEPKVLAFIASHSLGDLYISAVTLAELRFGIELLSKGDKRRDFEKAREPLLNPWDAA
jgi:predicted nucleic acid-binding protein